MNHKTSEYAELRLYIGSNRSYNGTPFSESQLVRVVQDFQTEWQKNHDDHLIPVRFSKCMYVAGDYIENGHELAIINYPRKPRPLNMLNEFMNDLQDHLMIEFGQNRITVMKDWDGCPRSADMSERPDAEASHK